MTDVGSRYRLALAICHTLMTGIPAHHIIFRKRATRFVGPDVMMPKLVSPISHRVSGHFTHSQMATGKWFAL